MDPKSSREKIDFAFFTLALGIRTIFRNLTKNSAMTIPGYYQIANQ